MLDEKAFFATINQVLTLALRTYGMTVKKFIFTQTAELGLAVMPQLSVAKLSILPPRP
jgi:hypothetical protein